jgi:hypothetical protein
MNNGESLLRKQSAIFFDKVQHAVECIQVLVEFSVGWTSVETLIDIKSLVKLQLNKCSSNLPFWYRSCDLFEMTR